jgi:YHS domain-containing protein
MIRRVSALLGFAVVACATSASSFAHAGDGASESREIPAAFAPLEYLIGEWKGTGSPKGSGVQQFRGWTEKHAWAWIFRKGKPSGLSFTIEGGKIVASGKLSFDPETKVYRLEGKEPGTPARDVAFEGKLDSSGKQLVLERVGEEKGLAADAGEMRISLRPNANYLRYTMNLDRKPPDGAVFSRTIEVGVTKEGEAFAAGATASERPKCIVTGGLATLSVSFEGKTFPLCCSGCLGEFNENPEKYVKKAALMVSNQAGKPKSGATAARVRGRDDAFAGDVSESSESARPAAKPKKNESRSTGKVAKADAADGESTDSAKSKDKPAAKKDTAKAPAANAAARAATIVRLARALERGGKTEQALSNYRQVVKDYADTPSAKTAAERIKELERKD